MSLIVFLLGPFCVYRLQFWSALCSQRRTAGVFFLGLGRLRLHGKSNSGPNPPSCLRIRPKRQPAPSIGAARSVEYSLQWRGVGCANGRGRWPRAAERRAGHCLLHGYGQDTPPARPPRHGSAPYSRHGSVRTSAHKVLHQTQGASIPTAGHFCPEHDEALRATLGELGILAPLGHVPSCMVAAAPCESEATRGLCRNTARSKLFVQLKDVILQSGTCCALSHTLRMQPPQALPTRRVKRPSTSAMAKAISSRIMVRKAAIVAAFISTWCTVLTVGWRCQAEGLSHALMHVAFTWGLRYHNLRSLR